MAKYCVFCGKPPTEKNKEHVIPQWLLRMTGDPNRVVNLGFSKNFKSGWKRRAFAFDQLTFPACEACNEGASALEVVAKSCMERVLAEQPISAEDLSDFLDWFDKVRVGLWLGFNQLDKNYAEVTPNFHINSRIGQADRVLLVEKTDFSPDEMRLTVGGVDTYSFAMTPSVFRLTVNGYFFTNLSYSFLVSRRLGFPYPSAMYLLPDREEMFCAMQPGRDRLMLPVVPQLAGLVGIALFQPMFKSGLVSGEMPTGLYDVPYVRENSLDYEAGHGCIFVSRGLAQPQVLHVGEEVRLLPDMTLDDWDTFKGGSIRLLKWLDWVNDFPRVDRLTTPQKQYVKQKKRIATRVNQMLIDAISKSQRPGSQQRFQQAVDAQ